MRALCIACLLLGCGDDASPRDGGFDGGARDSGLDASRDSGSDAGNPFGPRAANTTCRLPHASELATYTWVRSFPSLPVFDQVLWAGTAPDDDGTMYAVERSGTITAFDNRPDVAERTTVLTIPVRLVGSEQGLLGLAFHPRFGEDDRFFVNYTSDVGCPPGARLCNVISEFRRTAPRISDPSTERRILVIGKPYGNHNGGSLHFGNDGYLYVALGDGGGGGVAPGDPRERLGSILRIDVDGTGPSTPYAIPPTNPFADGAAGAPEVYVWGIRNAWRTSIDPVTNALWIGDVGATTNEEVDKVTGPAHLGWNVIEGNVCFRAAECTTDGLTPPLYAYDRTIGAVVVGGEVYRGTELRELWGKYLFADYVRGNVFALTERSDAPPDVVSLFRIGAPASFGHDNHGRLFIASFPRGITHLARMDSVGPTPLPSLLSETGCFDDVAAHTPAPGVLPYEVNVAEWSDGATHARFIALPDLERAVPALDGAWSFPVGTVFIETLTIDAESGPRRLETRMLSHEPNGWRGFTWRWLPDQSDAVLLETGAEESIATADGPLVWRYPSRARCEQCHSAAHGHVLGFRSRELERDVLHGGVLVPQLGALVAAGYVAPLDGTPASHPALDDEARTLEERVRAYLDVNCASCHRPDGMLRAGIDLRVETPLADTGLCGAPLYGDLGIAGAALVAPGSPETSVLHARLSRLDSHRMPMFHSARVDRAAAALVEEWIRSAACP